MQNGIDQERYQQMANKCFSTICDLERQREALQMQLQRLEYSVIGADLYRYQDEIQGWIRNLNTLIDQLNTTANHLNSIAYESW